MARITLEHRSVVKARKLFRSKNGPQSTVNWVMRRVGKDRYILHKVEVSAAQRKCRNLFLLAIEFAKADRNCRARRRYWGRIAKRRGLLSAYHAAMGFYMRELKTGRLTEADLRNVGRRPACVRKRVPLSVGFLAGRVSCKGGSDGVAQHWRVASACYAFGGISPGGKTGMRCRERTAA